MLILWVKTANENQSTNFYGRAELWETNPGANTRTKLTLKK